MTGREKLNPDEERRLNVDEMLLTINDFQSSCNNNKKKPYPTK